MITDDLWLSVLEKAQAHYRAVRTKRAMEYAQGRGISEDVFHELEMGCGREDKPLGDILTTEEIEVAETLGLLWRDGRDSFIDRLTIPLRDEVGGLRGITSRAMFDTKMRYWTTHRDPVCICGHPHRKRCSDCNCSRFESRRSPKDVLLGLHLELPRMRKERTVFLVEGPLDLAVCWSNDARPTIASLGTNLSDRQIALLTRYTGEYVEVGIMFDAPPEEKELAVEAMKKLVSKTHKRLQERGVQSKRIILPSGMDPADYFNSQ